MLLRTGQQLFTERDLRWRQDWTSIDNMTEAMPLAVFCAEDQNFFRHNGFDVDAIAEAWEDYRAGRDSRGASSISQQVAKNVFLLPTRSWIRKGLEVYFTILIETFWTKKRILEVYLNIAELGNGIYGVQAAAQIYFHKPAAALTRAECALLAASLPSPLHYSVTHPGPYMRRQQQWILNQMAHWNYQLDFRNPPILEEH